MSKHIVIDARIRRASTGRPVDRLLEYLQTLDTDNQYTILLEPSDTWQPRAKNFKTVACDYKQFSFNPLQQVKFSRQLKNLQPDLVHFTLTGQQPLFYFGKQITMTHDLTMYKYVRAGGLPQWLHQLRMLGYRLLMWSAHRKAKQIIVPTNYVKDALAKFHPFTARKITIAPESSEPPLQVTAQKPEFANGKFILCVGTAFPHKNLQAVVDAFEELHAKNPDLHLIMAGKKEKYYQELDAYIATKSYADHIVTPGFVSDEELKWLYEHALVYVFPSLSEGFGLPGLEAMTHGCPVVSSNATCLPEVYGQAAQYFDPTDITDIAKQIQVVMDDQSHRKYLIKKGHEQLAKYSWQHFAEQNLAVYDQTKEMKRGNMALFRRYIFVGGGVYLLEMLTIVVAQKLGIGPIAAVALSFWLGLLASFGLHKLVTFGDKRMHHRLVLRQFLAFSVLVLFNFGFTILVTQILRNILPAAIIRTLALGATTLWNLYLYRTRIFKIGDGIIY